MTVTFDDIGKMLDERFHRCELLSPKYIHRLQTLDELFRLRNGLRQSQLNFYAQNIYLPIFVSTYKKVRHDASALKERWADLDSRVIPGVEIEDDLLQAIDVMSCGDAALFSTQNGFLDLASFSRMLRFHQEMHLALNAAYDAVLDHKKQLVAKQITIMHPATKGPVDQAIIEIWRLIISLLGRLGLLDAKGGGGHDRSLDRNRTMEQEFLEIEERDISHDFGDRGDELDR